MVDKAGMESEELGEQERGSKALKRGKVLTTPYSKKDGGGAERRRAEDEGVHGISNQN